MGTVCARASGRKRRVITFAVARGGAKNEFRARSFVTALATMTLAPGSFNFSRAGLAKVGTAALVIGIKSVLLYLKQSPLPAQPAGIANWTKITSVMAVCVIVPATMAVSGCVNSWERTTYASLAASKAVIDCAVAGYNHFDADIRHACAADPRDAAFDATTFYLPQTRGAQQAVEKARQAQVATVEAFAAYAVAKVGKDPAASLAEKQAAVVAYLQQLPALVKAVQTLMGKNPAVGVNGATNKDPMAAITALRPELDMRE